jgi:hypothetical protein
MKAIVCRLPSAFCLLPFDGPRGSAANGQKRHCRAGLGALGLAQLHFGRPGNHPRLLGGFIVAGGEIEDPVLFDKLVAKIKGKSLQSRQGAIIGADAVRPYQQQQVGPGSFLGAAGDGFGSLPIDLPLDLGANGPHRRARLVLGVKDQAVGRALNVDGFTAFSPPALVRHQRIGLLVPFPEQFDFLESLFEPV